MDLRMSQKQGQQSKQSLPEGDLEVQGQHLDQVEVEVEAAAPTLVRQAGVNQKLDAALGRMPDGSVDLARVDPGQIKNVWNAGGVQSQIAILSGLRAIVAKAEDVDAQPDVEQLLEDMDAEGILDDASRGGTRLTDVIRRVIFHESDVKIPIRAEAAQLATDMAEQGVGILPAVDALKTLSRDPERDVRLVTVKGLGAAMQTAEVALSYKGRWNSQVDNAYREMVLAEADIAMQRLEFDKDPVVQAAAKSVVDRLQE